MSSLSGLAHRWFFPSNRKQISTTDESTQRKRSGTATGGKDLLIAAQAVTIDAVLVKDNVRESRGREFGRAKGCAWRTGCGRELGRRQGGSALAWF
jgi:hypothetical protein